MKTRLQTILRAIVVFAYFAITQIAFAQGTAFTYQGRLNNGANPATGLYDLRFTIYDDATVGNAGGALTNAATPVTNGLFTVMLDFGAGVFTGADRWLEIGVRTNGATDFAMLVPRQPITAMPYAIQALNAASATTAASANSVSAANITGPILLPQLPGVLVTNGASGVVLTGSFSGNGSGLTNVNLAGFAGAVNWQAAADTSVQTMPNAGYVVTNDLLTTLTLPGSPHVGDIIRITGAGFGGWQLARNPGQSINTSILPAMTPSNNMTLGWRKVALTNTTGTIACSAGNSHFINIYTRPDIFGRYFFCYDQSTSDFGTNLTNIGSIQKEDGTGLVIPSELAVSADATKIVVLGQTTAWSDGYIHNYNQQIYTSADSGATWRWRTNGLPLNYNAGGLVSSADGTILYVTVSGQVYASSDSGVTWTIKSDWPYPLAMSADGTKLVANNGSGISFSTDSGTTWNTPESLQASDLWWAAMSADGTKMATFGFTSGLITSADAGATWVDCTNAPKATIGVNLLISADGSKLILVGDFAAYSSTNSGASFQKLTSLAVYFIAISGDGSQILIEGDSPVASGAYFYQPDWTLHGGQGDSIELQYVGNGVFLPISVLGGITAY